MPNEGREDEKARYEVTDGVMVLTKPSTTKTCALLLAALCLLSVACSQAPKDSPGQVRIEGSGVKEAAAFDLEQLKSMKHAVLEADYLSINTYGTRERGTYTGVGLWQLISELTSLSAAATEVTVIGEDGYTVTYTLDQIKKEDYIDEERPEVRLKMMVAFAEDGQDFNPALGSPFQLVVGQRKPGDINRPYWVRQVKTIRID